MPPATILKISVWILCNPPLRLLVSCASRRPGYPVYGEIEAINPAKGIKGPDNIRINNGNLIITSHSKPFKFIGHVKDKSQKSPSLVLSVDPHTGKSTRLFYDDGKLISAASVALIFNNQLVIGQIFEPFIWLLDIQR
ncbi:MAG: hypothetical protein WC865_08760 [Bacteroidales bacterium]